LRQVDVRYFSIQAGGGGKGSSSGRRAIVVSFYEIYGGRL
jgi:hypothetical protein